VATGNSNISSGEFFIDVVGTNGLGTALSASPAAPTSTLSGSISTTTLNGLTAGNHTVYVHAKDVAGNWGATVSATFLIDRTAPALTSISLSPSSFIVGNASTVTMTTSGASDSGGSGLNGGEYWINPPTSTTPAPGSGTQFAGTSANIPVGAFAAGSYTVSARMKDGAGNWSPIRTATLTVVPDAIFSDGFESGNFSAWSSRSTTNTTRLNVTAGSALAGSFGLQAQGNNTNYVQYNFTPTTGTYDARFYFRPNGNTSTGKDIFSAATSSGFGTTLFRVRYRLNAGTPQVQVQVGSTANATWTNILGGTSNNYIEVTWTSGGTLQLYVNGTLSQTLTAGTGSVAAIRLGSITNTGNATAMYFDAFVSKRLVSPLVGP
jgi:hypothetical protein